MNDLKEYQVNNSTYQVGDKIQLTDIAYDLVHNVKDWQQWKGVNKELSDLLLPSPKDFQSLYYCFHAKDKLFTLGNLSKIFSLSIFELSRIFEKNNKIFFLFNDAILYEVNQSKQPFKLNNNKLSLKEAFVYEKDIQLLGRIVEIFEAEQIHNLISENERLNQESDFYTFHLPYITYKWGIRLNYPNINFP